MLPSGKVVYKRSARSVAGRLPAGLLFGQTYRSTITKLDGSNSSWGSLENRLARALRFAFKNTQAGKQLDLESELQDGDPLEILKRVKSITRKDLAANPEAYQSKTRRLIRHRATTGGTTGKPVEVSFDRALFGTEWAFKHHLWSQYAGWSFGVVGARIRGSQKDDSPVGFDPLYREVTLSPFHQTVDDIRTQLAALQSERVEVLRGYPSAIARLALQAKDSGESFPSLKSVISISENLSESQRELISSAFTTKVWTFYGHTERCLIAAECLATPGVFHFDERYGFCEILKPEEDTEVHYGEMGEIVGTSIANQATPLVRYRTGDFAVRIKKVCGCPTPGVTVSSLKGRWGTDFVRKSGGDTISLTALNVHSADQAHIDELQFIQDDWGTVTVRVVCDENDRSHAASFCEKLTSMAGGDPSFMPKFVNHLESTSIGKTPLLIQRSSALETEQERNE